MDRQGVKRLPNIMYVSLKIPVLVTDMIDAILSTHRHPGSPVTLKNHTMLFDIID